MKSLFKAAALAAALSLLTPAVALSARSLRQQGEPAAPLTNKDVIQMVRAKVPEEIIIEKIRSSPCKFDKSVDAILELHDKGVTKDVMLAMLDASSPRPAGRGARPPAPVVEGAEESEDGDASGVALLADGTEFTVTPTEEINSKHSTEGQLVTFRVVEEVMAQGHRVIAKGALVRGTVTDVEGRGMLGKAGKLSVRIDNVSAVDGQKVRLRASKGKTGGSNTGKVIALSLLVTPLFLLMRGNTARIKPGQHLQVFTDEDKEIVVPASTAGAGAAAPQAVAPQTSPGAAPYVSPGTGRSPGTDVHVRGHYRKDGTYVRPHTRSAPRRRS